MEIRLSPRHLAMTKISSKMSDKIRSLWKAGHFLSDIRAFLLQSGVHVSDNTIRRHLALRRRTHVTKKPTVLKMNRYYSRVYYLLLSLVYGYIIYNCSR